MKQLLSENQLLQIKELQETCESHEGLSLKLNWDMLRNRTGDTTEDLFHYEDRQLVGFIGIYFIGEKVELCGMVHPTFRRNRIFTNLLNKAMEIIPKGSTILLNAPEVSQSAKEFLKSQNCDFSFSEYQMVCRNKEIPKFEQVVQFTKATPADFSIVTKLDAECFGFESKDAEKYNSRILNEPNRILYLIEVNSEIIGKLSIQRENNESWIYGFAIFPKYQGKGYGKNTLLQIIEQESNLGNEIHLEVALENRNAKKLYTDCGFEQYNTQDYYLAK